MTSLFIDALKPPEQPIVDFAWEELFSKEETITEHMEHEAVFEVLLYIAQFIFNYDKEDIKRTDRSRVIAGKSLAAFFCLLGKRLGTTNAAAIRRISGLNVQDQTLRYHMRRFKEYVSKNKLRP